MLPRILGVVLSFSFALSARGGPLFADEFEDVSAWAAAGSDGVRSSVMHESDEAERSGGSLRLDFDFQRGSGFAVFRRDVEIDLPANWRITFEVRGECASNNFEFKLIDETGDNVWWVNKRAFEFPREWRALTLKKRQFSFAWGPGGAEKGLKKIRAIELAVTAGSGGRGSVWIDSLRVEEIAADSEDGPVTIRVSSSAEGHEPPGVLPRDGGISWSSKSDDGEPWIELDFGGARDIGGVSIDWAGVIPQPFRVNRRDADGSWHTVTQRFQTFHGPAHVRMPECEATAIRVGGENVTAGMTIRSIRVRDVSFSENPNAFLRAVAADSPRGWYPRSFLGEQNYWTVIGVPWDEAEALISEDGALELGKGGPTIEPFLWFDDRLWTWADAEITHSLAAGALPIPSVTWRAGDIRLEITAFADGPAGGADVSATYRVHNDGSGRKRVELFLALRPLQVLPPTHELNMVGGVSPIEQVKTGRGFATPRWRVFFGRTPSEVEEGAAAFDSGDVVRMLRSGLIPSGSSATDSGGLASAAARFTFDLEAGASAEVTWVAGLSDPSRGDAPLHSPAPVSERLDEAEAQWRGVVDRVSFALPDSARRYADTFRSQVAYILINRDGAAIQPGSRSYDRTWIRDGALTSTALLYSGHPEEVRAFIDWFAPFQYENGKIPCCADERGPDPVPEHDSHGEFIYAVAEYDRFMRDDAFVRSHAERVARAVDYIESLRAQRMTDSYTHGEGLERAKYGLMPESISHEGYSAKAMHSYWDDFWALRGLEDAAYIGERVGDDALGARAAAAATSMRTCLYDSMRLAMAIKGIDYIPGCVELGDFDATSTSIGVFPIGEWGRIPEPQLKNTFERYAKWFDDRAAGRLEWKDYTPYEIRNTTTFLFLGRRDVTHRMMDFFFRDQRPAGWNAWAEVVRNGYRTPGFIGDLPHTWVGSDFVKLLRTMFVHERVSDGALVVGMGITREWMEAVGGAAAGGLPTHFGVVGISFFMRDGARVVSLAGDLDAPPGGVEVALEDLRGAEILADGKRVGLDAAGRLVVAWPVREVVIRGGE
ncbi:MAG: coagulation factor 5/8 type domain-containing protein [Phycisphaerae bacterium]|nr:coagulation factor 5/8 type domain-containing protein [Phycisphaerae bacterium]